MGRNAGGVRRSATRAERGLSIPVPGQRNRRLRPRRSEGEELEPNFYRQPAAFHAETKRFFDEPMVRAAVEGHFEVRHLEHKTIYRYQDPKRIWECLAFAP